MQAPNDERCQAQQISMISRTISRLAFYLQRKGWKTTEHPRPELKRKDKVCFSLQN